MTSPSPSAASVVAAKKAIVHALSKKYFADPADFPIEKAESDDIADLVRSCFGAQLDDKPAVLKWAEYARDFPGKNGDVSVELRSLNEELSTNSTILGDSGFKTSPADVIVYATVHPYVSNLSDLDVQNLPHLGRWMDYIQNVEDFGSYLEKIPITKPGMVPFWSSNRTVKVDVSSDTKKVALEPTGSDKANNDSSAKVEAEAKVPTEDKKSLKSKKNMTSESEEKLTKDNGKIPADGRKTQMDSSEKDAECNVSILNIQIGLIRKAHKHPSADSLLVEEIDLGDGNVRQVVSGLAKYCTPEELCNRYVVLITNVKPGKLRDVMSSGLVLCASNEDHSVVEPLIPPEGAKIGERVSFSGYDGKPEDVLNPKKKQLEKITPHLYTDEAGVATFKGIPFMTSAGPCRSSICKASIK